MKKILAGLLLSAITAACYAAPVSVEISFVGADYACGEHGHCWDPSARLEVSFAGEDLNNDQVITVDEVSKLQGIGIDFLSPSTPQDTYYIHDFQYRSNSDLVIVLSHVIHFPDGSSDWPEYAYVTATGAGWHNTTGGPWSTNRSTVVSISSVPEPSGIAMSAIGLGLVGFAARRRQRAASR